MLAGLPRRLDRVRPRALAAPTCLGRRATIVGSRRGRHDLRHGRSRRDRQPREPGPDLRGWRRRSGSAAAAARTGSRATPATTRSTAEVTATSSPAVPATTRCTVARVRTTWTATAGTTRSHAGTGLTGSDGGDTLNGGPGADSIDRQLGSRRHERRRGSRPRERWRRGRRSVRRIGADSVVGGTGKDHLYGSVIYESHERRARRAPRRRRRGRHLRQQPGTIGCSGRTAMTNSSATSSSRRRTTATTTSTAGPGTTRSPAATASTPASTARLWQRATRDDPCPRLVGRERIHVVGTAGRRSRVPAASRRTSTHVAYPDLSVAALFVTFGHRSSLRCCPRGSSRSADPATAASVRLDTSSLR